GRDAAHGGDQLGCRRVLQHVSGRTRLHRGEEQVGVGEGGEHHHAEVGQGFAQGSRRVDAVHVRQLDVHQHEVGGALAERVHVDGGGGAVTHHRQVGLGVETLHDPVAEERVVLDDHDAVHWYGLHG